MAIQNTQQETLPRAPNTPTNRRYSNGYSPSQARRGGRPNKAYPVYSSDSSYSSDENQSPNIPRSQRPHGRSQFKRRHAPRQSAPLQKARHFAAQYEMRHQMMMEYQSAFVAMDCEMVGVGECGVDSALARVTIVDWYGTIVLDEYVLPEQPVTDYRTFVSGITADKLVGAASFETVQSKVIQILTGRILVGHGLENDLRALRIHHPWQMTRDTAKYEPMMKVRFNDNKLWPRKLRDLAAEHLGRHIQVPGAPHSPIEDAVAALDLYKTVQPYFEQNISYKIQSTNGHKMRQ